MSEFGICAYGAYVPRMRLDRGIIAAAHKWAVPSLRGMAKGSRSFCNWDEDTITMGVEAVRDVMTVPAATDEVDVIGFASTNAPYADLQPSAIIAGATGLPEEIRALDNGFSQRAGTSALLAMIKSAEPGILVASDAPGAKPASAQEMTYGAGAAAFRFGSKNVAARLIGHSTSAVSFVDHFRDQASRFDYHWEERWIRDEGYAKLVPATVARALEMAGLKIADIDKLALASMLRGAETQIAKALGFGGDIVDGLSDGCGYCGAAHAPLMLVHALEQAKAGERLLVISFGQGVDALIFETTKHIKGAGGDRGLGGALAHGIETDSYLRMLSFADGIDIDWGMRSEKSAKTALTEQYRSRGQIESFNAGKCGDCGKIQFPQLQYCANCHAPAAKFEAVSLRDAPAKVMNQTADWLSYYPSPPLRVGFVQFENGARLQMEFVDVGADGIDIGTPLKMVFRIKERDRQRGYSRYFWKAVPDISAERA